MSAHDPDSRDRTASAGRITVLAGIIGFLGVAIGAFGAHALKDVLVDQRGDWFETGVLYHLLHAPMIAICAVLSRDEKCARAARLAAGGFAVGVLLFSFSLYAMALGAPKGVAAITPFGGISLLVGWVFVARSGWIAARA